ncbi:MAG TPA: glycosyltransferase family 4 protein, partial [Candidatus Solibacter sp.]|nr:glycosyltransferase family 4 protein [Candidatus Solibacter sp.]
VIVFFADFGEGGTWRLLSRFKDLPVSLYLCYPPSAVPHRYRSFVRLSWHRRAKRVFADAAWVSKEAEQLFGRSIPVLPPGTDPERFRPHAALRAAMRQRYGFTDQDVVLLNVSELECRKGPRRVVEAVHRLRDRFPNLRYFILGTGEDEPVLRRLVHGRGLGEQVIFGGRTTHLEAYYNLADIFVMLPEAEANSVACHEAMSSGLPVVASDTGGFPESVPSQAGLFAAPDNAAEIDAALARLIEDPSLRRSMGEAGRAHILANCTWDQAADRFLDLVA